MQFDHDVNRPARGWANRRFRLLTIAALFVAAIIAANILAERLEIRTVAGLQISAVVGSILFWGILTAAWLLRKRFSEALALIARIAEDDPGKAIRRGTLSLLAISF